MFDKSKHEGKKHFCMSWLQCFLSERILNNHKQVFLYLSGLQATKMPDKSSEIKFENFHKQLHVPFVMYVDFEAITEKITGCTPNGDKSYTEAYQIHKNCLYSKGCLLL